MCGGFCILILELGTIVSEKTNKISHILSLFINIKLNFNNDRYSRHWQILNNFVRFLNMINDNLEWSWWKEPEKLTAILDSIVVSIPACHNHISCGLVYGLTFTFTRYHWQKSHQFDEHLNFIRCLRYIWYMRFIVVLMLSCLEMLSLCQSFYVVSQHIIKCNNIKLNYY